MAAVGWCLLGVCAPLAVAPAAGQETGAYAIPAGDLGRALLELARQSGRNLLFDGTALRGRRSRAVAGIDDFATALRTLTEGSGVACHIAADGTVTVAPAAVSAPPPSVPAPSAGGARDAEGGGPQEVLVTGDRRAGRGDIALPPAVLAEGLSAAQLRQVPDQNVAESLGRLLGVNVMMTSLQGDLGGIDRAARAEGQFTAIRGLGSAYNLTRIDGVAVAQSMPYGREVQLSLMPPAAVDGVVLRKTLDAAMDGDATGGIIDFHMPGAFDDGGAPRASLQAQGLLADRPLSYGRPGAGGMAQGLVSRVFGRDDSLGLAVSAYYGLRHFASSEQTYQQGQLEYRVTDASGQPPAGRDPAADLLLTSLNAQYSEGRTERHGLTAALDWRPDGPVSAYARMSWAYADTQQDVYQMGFQGGRDASFLSHTPLGGGLYLTGSTRTQLHYWFETNPDIAALGTAQLGGAWKSGALTVEPRLFYSWGRNDRPEHIELSFWSPTATTAAGGLDLAYRDGYPVPRLSDAAQSLLRGLSAFPVSNRGEVTSLMSHQDRGGGGVDVHYDLGTQGLTRVQAGVKLVDSQRRFSRRDQEGQNAGGLGAVDAGTSLGDLAGLGLRAGGLDSLLGGIYDYAVPLIDGQRFTALYDRRDHGLAWTPDAWNGNSLSGSEWVAAGYVQGRWLYGPLEIVPGVRLEASRIDSRYWLSGNNGVPVNGVAYGWNSSSSGYGALLPRLLVNYRPAADQVYRAALWTSYTRPSPYQLAGNATTAIDADGVVTVTRGNPALKPVRVLNADLSGEWGWRTGPGAAGGDGHLELALFYKRLSDYLYDSGGNYNSVATTGNAYFQVSMPSNGGTAEIWGSELGVVQDLSFLPSPFDGLGAGGSLSWETTGVRLGNPALATVEQVQNAPRWLAGLRLFYVRAGFTTTLNYRWVDAYIQQYGLLGTSAGGVAMNGSALDTWVRPARRLDLRTAYDVADGVEIAVGVRNLLGDIAYRSTVGRHGAAAPQTIDAGRDFTLSARLDY